MGTIFLLIIVFLLALALIKLNSPEFKGKSGEKLVAERLDIISGYKHIMNDVIFDDNGQSRQVDHIAITEYGVYVIETKNYTGNIYGKETSNEWKQYINKQCFKFKNPIHQNYGHLQIVKQHIEQITKEIYPIVTFIRRCNLKVDTSSPVVYEDQLSTYIMGRSKVLNIEQIDNIYEILSKAKINDELSNGEHIQNVKNHLEENKQLIDNEICPRCKGKLIRRNGKKGPFLGCSNFPKCRFTKEIENVKYYEILK